MCFGGSAFLLGTFCTTPASILNNSNPTLSQIGTMLATGLRMFPASKCAPPSKLLTECQRHALRRIDGWQAWLEVMRRGPGPEAASEVGTLHVFCREFGQTQIEFFQNPLTKCVRIIIIAQIRSELSPAQTYLELVACQENLVHLHPAVCQSSCSSPIISPTLSFSEAFCFSRRATWKRETCGPTL